MELLADSGCSTLLPGIGAVSIQSEWPAVRTAVWPLVWQDTIDKEDHIVCQHLWDSWWAHTSHIFNNIHQSYIQDSCLNPSYTGYFFCTKKSNNLKFLLKCYDNYSKQFYIHFFFYFQVILCTWWATQSGSCCQAGWWQVSLHKLTLLHTEWQKCVRLKSTPWKDCVSLK